MIYSCYSFRTSYILLLVYLHGHSVNGSNVLIGWFDLPTLQIIFKSVPHWSPSIYTKTNDTLKKILSSMILVFSNCILEFCKSLKTKKYYMLRIKRY